MNILKLVLFLGLFSACSGAKSELTQREKTYLEVQDSLKKYQVEILDFDEDTMNNTIKDYTRLNYQNFKAKHRLHDDEMDLLTVAFTTRYEIGRIQREINANSFHINPDFFKPLTKTKKGDLKLDRNLKTTKISTDEKTQEKVLWQAFEGEKKK